jgi:hypothetical protein
MTRSAAWAAAVMAVVMAGSARGQVIPPASQEATGRAHGDGEPRLDLLDLMGTEDASPQQVRDAGSYLEMRRQLVIVSIAGKKARVQGLEEAVAEAQSQVRKAVSEDQTIAALKKAVGSLQQQLASAESTRSSPLDITVRLMDIAQYTNLIAQRELSIETELRSGALPELMKELLRARADLLELQGELAGVGEQLGKLHKITAGRR